MATQVHFESIPSAPAMGRTDHLSVHAVRCQPRPGDYARISVTAFRLAGDRPTKPITCTLVEAIGTREPGWIDFISERGKLADELVAFLNERFGPDLLFRD